MTGRHWSTHARSAGTSLWPLGGALLLSAVVLYGLGADPWSYYGVVVRRGLLSPTGLAAVLTRMGPLLLLGASLIVAFRTGFWNLGGDAQFMLGALAAAVVMPPLLHHVPWAAATGLGLATGTLAGAVWGVVPGLLRARHGLNEVVTTLMMNFLGLSLVNLLIKLVFFDPTTTVPQTATLPVDDRLPRLFGTTISSGLLIGLGVLVLVQGVMSLTAFGLRLRIVGASPLAAIHAGLAVPRLTVASFAISAGLAGLAGAVEVVGIEGTVRADQNPGFAFAVVPLVFLARLNGIAAIGFIFLYAVLSIGGESAARATGIPNTFTLVVLALVLAGLATADRLHLGQGA